ncbi:hypothetical protein D4764_20G0002880 [Takifugu flavidus]|uniref:Uncharacterized protein n=1 Tax=Takifugu flavidus TaxID=433684 RepID=A0A5C6NGN0_9TELE|nr:hypothetical protein D4764_20G0002880 [Takifugu flavidus]
MVAAVVRNVFVIQIRKDFWYWTKPCIPHAVMLERPVAPRAKFPPPERLTPRPHADIVCSDAPQGGHVQGWSTIAALFAYVNVCGFACVAMEVVSWSQM